MAGKIIINTERCKGCGLCVTVCPNGGIIISKQSNKSGYFPAEPAPSKVEGAKNADCTGCAVCAIICPDAAIEVYRDNNVVDKPRKKTAPSLIKGKK
jgi:2-oxoglutarate ferredoxin oxidoreductase subunit delta